MGQYFEQKSFYSQQPFDFNGDREETFIIDVPGIWVPECEIIFYGLLGTKYAEELYKIRERTNLKQRSVYLDFSYFESKDLVRYLSSVDDELDQEISDKEVEEIINVALNNYMYKPCSETMMRHSIMELMYMDFVKKVTLVYPWKLRGRDVMFIKAITPDRIFEKIELADGTIPEIIKDSGETYTTIISNSIDQIEFLVDNAEEYRTVSALYLLRNHSGNMIMTKNEDGTYDFLEGYMESLFNKLVNIDTGTPRTPARFGRFEPKLFSDMEKRIPKFRQV